MAKKMVVLKLKEMLVKRDMSQREFSEVAGILYKNVAKMCNGQAPNPNLEVLGRCCDVLNCELDDLMELVEVEGEYDPKHIRPRVLPRYDSKGMRILDDGTRVKPGPRGYRRSEEEE